MKRMFALFAIALVTAAANAGSLILDGRLDNLSQSFNDDAAASGLGHNNNRYVLKTARLDYQGSLNESTLFRARLILTKSDQPVQVRDSLSEFVDLVYVTHKWTDMFEGTFGKFSSEMGGTEHAYVSSPDVYYFSTAYEGMSSKLDNAAKAVLTASGKTVTTIGGVPGTMRYHTGVKVTGKPYGQEIQLQSTNLTVDDANSTPSAQTSTLLGVVYKGNIAEKMFQPVLSYHTGHFPSGGNGDAKVTYMAAGVRMNMAGHTIDADYLMNQFKGRTKMGTTEFGDDSINSMLLHWQWTIDQFTPHLKAEQGKIEVASTKVFDVTGFSAALEFKPVTDQIFRYHVAYNNKTYKAAEGDNSLNLQEIMAGVRISADFLKQ